MAVNYSTDFLGGPHADPFGYRKILQAREVVLSFQGHGQAFTPPCDGFVNEHRISYSVDRHEQIPDGPVYAFLFRNIHGFGTSNEEDAGLTLNPYQTVEACVEATDKEITRIARRYYEQWSGQFSFLGMKSRRVGG